MKIEQVLDIVDRTAAWAWIRRTHLDGGLVKCPICGAIVTGARALASFKEMKRTFCQSHGSTFQAFAAIAQLRGTQWAPDEYVKLRLLHLANFQPQEISRILGKSASCIKDMLDRCAALEGLLPAGPSFLACCSTDKG